PTQMRATPETGSTAAPANLSQGYRPAPGGFDEMLAAPGTPRPHWQRFVNALDQLGRHELASRWENGRRIIREHGVTYNVYGDPQGMDRPWELDMVPLLVPFDEWQRIEAGLIQRARLLNLILADLYGGAQHLLRDGFLPPELVYANPGFLRPCHGIRAPKDIYLHLHAADLARSPDGQWWVLADRTQAPSGTGYALENRVVLSRVLPEEFRDCQVQRLAGFFRAQRDTLQDLAPTNRDHPTVVLLTPGPHNETYFEHAYLARYLGFPLVEGGDLTVRDRRVFIKTLEGLQPVDVILRRVDDTFCDPLELRGDSFLGVPGLVEATRAGNVTVANALGAGLVESPAFLAFLPFLCRRLLGEELLLPSVATWWCGQGNEQQYVLDHLDGLVIKPAFGTTQRERWIGALLGAADRGKLLKAIRTRPHEFIGQERAALSRAPVWAEDHLEARSVVLRTYVAAGGGSFVVMPGGLTRVSSTTEDPIISMQTGGGSKDTWVLASGPVVQAPMPATLAEPRHGERAFSGVPSRVAENLFWLGRYTERLEQTLRILRCVLGRLTDESGGEGSTQLAALTTVMANLGMLPERFHDPAAVAELPQRVLRLVYKSDITGSVRELLGRIRLIVSLVRDRFSGDTWRILNRLELDSRTRAGRLPLANAVALIHTLVLDLAAFNGMEMENMTRGHGWRFLDLGRRLERAINLAKLLRAGIATDARPDVVFEPLLEIADSVMTYRRHYFAEPALAPVLELLVGDATNPRSLAFQFEALRTHAAVLPAAPGEQPIVLPSVIEQLAATKLAELAAQSGQGQRGPLENFLAGIDTELAAFAEQVTHRYFSHSAQRVS
ncbi:MAG TPA: circularly permuted type 2 ATP-grasp protein, partial [Verrucomicrobiae bacterium]